MVTAQTGSVLGWARETVTPRMRRLTKWAASIALGGLPLAIVLILGLRSGHWVFRADDFLLLTVVICTTASLDIVDDIVVRSNPEPFAKWEYGVVVIGFITLFFFACLSGILYAAPISTPTNTPNLLATPADYSLPMSIGGTMGGLIVGTLSEWVLAGRDQK